MFSKEYIREFMLLQFGIQVENDNVGEEAVLLFKEEVDRELVTDEFLAMAPEKVLVYSYVFDNEGIEWMVCVATDANTNHPLFLLCIKNGQKIHESLLRDEEIEK